MSMNITKIAKADLHVHLEGAVWPNLTKKLAQRHGVTLPATLFNGPDSYHWQDFLHFLKVFDVVSELIRTPEDYRDVTYEYLKHVADDGGIYAEYMPSPSHAELAGMSYQNMLEGVVQGSIDAKRDFNVESRIVITAVRHLSEARAIKDAELAVKYAHPLVTGFGMGGDEAGFPPKPFAKAFAIAHEGGLSCTCHAGEWVGPDGIREAITYLPLARLSHGVRCIEDPNLMAELRDRNIALDTAPGSNVTLGVYPDYAHHPFKKLRDFGLKATLSTDDPPFFNTTIGKEYAAAAQHFGYDEAGLKDITRTAIDVAFCDETTKQQLRQRI